MELFVFNQKLCSAHKYVLKYFSDLLLQTLMLLLHLKCGLLSPHTTCHQPDKPHCIALQQRDLRDSLVPILLSLKQEVSPANCNQSMRLLLLASLHQCLILMQQTMFFKTQKMLHKLDQRVKTSPTRLKNLSKT